MSRLALRRRVRPVHHWLLVAALVGCVLPASVVGQDIESVARLRGLTLPEAYYSRVAADPTAYQLPNGLFRTAADGSRLASQMAGTAKLAVVLALFSDSPDPHITDGMVQSSLFDGPAEFGTITDAYLEMSRGALTVTGTAFPWVRTSAPMATVVGTGNGLGSDANLGPYFLEALAGVDPGVDFGEFDSDGPDGVPNSGDDDGLVDALTFEFLEIAGSCGGPSIWPHRWGLSAAAGGAYETDDLRPDGSKVKVDGYITQSVTDCGGVNIQSANVISHEYGHVLGLPDYYHPTTGSTALDRRWILGCWDLMAGGSWGCGEINEPRDEPFGPSHMSAYNKNLLGWLGYTTVGEIWNQEILLDPVVTTGQALRVPLTSDGREFLLIEYRAQVGFDHQLPADGMLMYKVDLDASTRPNPASGAPYRIQLLEQDGDNGLQRNWFEGGDRGVAGDAWGVGGATRKLHSGTSPQLRLSAGGGTQVTVHEVGVANGKARVVMSNSLQPKIIPPISPIEVQQVQTFLEFVRVAGGVMPYTASGNVPGGITLGADGDEIFVGGSIVGEGTHDLVLRVTDARGTVSADVVVTVVATGAWSVTVGTLLQAFLRSTEPELSNAELSYLDSVGNGNGRYDVGDLRKWMRTGGN